MGVPGLWDIIRHTGKSEALAQIAIEGFRRDCTVQQLKGLPDGTPHPRALRIGIDASIWFFHAAYGREGENPELRTLFFRLARLASYTFCPLFVFDGPQRPKTKRRVWGKTINTRINSLAPGMKNMISAFGFEWRTAPGEAEAELAYLNNIGVIDAILSDDVDNFLFGARVVIRNPSGTLMGNRGYPALNSDGKDDGVHVMVYRADDIERDPACKLTRGGMILIALLSGGDYDQGAKRCGPKTALALAQRGLGDELLDAFQTFSRERLADYLPSWKAAVVEALRSGCANLGDDDEADAENSDDESQETGLTASQGSNLPASQRNTASKGQAKGMSSSKTKKRKPPAKRQPALAAAIDASDFPDLAVLEDYCAPWTSERAFSPSGIASGPVSTNLDDDDAPPASQGSVITSSQTSTKSAARPKKKSKALTINSVGAGGLTSDVRIGWTGELTLGALGRICEQYFEWGVREIIQQRFRTILWPAAVLRVFRRAVMERERAQSTRVRDTTPRPSTPKRGQSKQIVPGTPRRLVNRYFGGGSDSDSDAEANSGLIKSGSVGEDETPRAKRTITIEGEQLDTRQLVQAVRGKRQHVSTDRLREFRVEIFPAHLARLAVRDLLGTRDPALLAGTMFDLEGIKDADDEQDEDGEDEEGVTRRLKMVDPAAPVRVWVPAELVQMVHPELVRVWEEKGTKTRSKLKPSGSTAGRKGKGVAGSSKNGESTSRPRPKGKEVLKEKTRNIPTTLSGDEIEDRPAAPVPSTSRSLPEPLRPRPNLDRIRSGSPERKAPAPKVTKSKAPLNNNPRPTRTLGTIPERSSSPSRLLERSSSPVSMLAPVPRQLTKTKSAPAPLVSTVPKAPVSRIPGVEHVPSPPRPAAFGLGPASDSSELEDISFRGLLKPSKKHSAPEPDSDSDTGQDQDELSKCSRRSPSHTSPRNSPGSKVQAGKSQAKNQPPKSVTPPARRPITRSRTSSDGSEVEVLDSSSISRPVKHMAPSAEFSEHPETGPRRVRRTSREHLSPRAVSASENEIPNASALLQTITTKRATRPTTARQKSATASGSKRLSKSILPRVDDSVIQIASGSEDGGKFSPKIPSTSRVLLRSDGPIDRAINPPCMTRLSKVAKDVTSSPTVDSSFEVLDADASVIDLISD
ncbi:hypothetical protein CTheo_4793 [Ceratobasidium theobromae]|uniref:XPG-I domain-containing protein n=1 Tax=Ceratobasidium theobromae TaxID=1582974 RepID=A0A5N5QJW9_9AGAM|nr:hypothetical protein CTheo_4793 [Ceratobasidium theobromae]